MKAPLWDKKAKPALLFVFIVAKLPLAVNISEALLDLRM